MATAELKVRRSLWDIGGDLAALNELLDEREGEIGDCEQAIDEWLAELRDDVNDKSDRYAWLISELESIAETRTNEANRLASLADRDARKAKLLKDRLKQFMEMNGMPKLKSKFHEFTVCKNGGVQPMQVLWPADQIPEPFRRVRVEPDNDAIRLALKAGERLEFVEVLERGTHLRIK